MIRILLVDDQNLIQEGIKALLDQHTELKVIGTVKDGRNAVKLVGLLHPDIVLLDIEMPGMDGITVTKHISRIAPETKVIILTSYEDKKYIMQSLLAGAKGYILKSSLMKDLKQAILAVNNGYCQLESRLLAKVFNPNSVKLKKTNSIANSDSEEKQPEKEHIAEYSLTENQINSLEKEQNNFNNKDSEQLLSHQKDIPTGSKDNEFTVSLNSAEILSPMHSVLVKSEIQPVGSFDTLLTLPQTELTTTQPVESSNTLLQTESIPTQSPENTDTEHQTELTQIISVETSDTEHQTESISTQPVESSNTDIEHQTESIPTQPVATSDTEHQTELTPTQPVATANTDTKHQTEPIPTQPVVTSDTLSKNQQENIQNSNVPLLPVVNRMALLMSSEDYSLLEDNAEKPEKNNLAAKSSALKKYLIQLVSKKNISRYKTNASIIIFKYRLKFHQYRVQVIQYAKLKLSQYNQKNNKSKIELERYKTKLLFLIRYWNEKGLFSNIGLMILGAVIFFLIHSMFN